MFKWGRKKGDGRTNKNFQFFESFTYSGVEYWLYDCVYLYNAASVDAYIGKIVRIYETPAKERRVKVVWLFRPSEIRNFLGDYEPRWNELFLASGLGKGLSNVNPLEAIIGKCNVVCASNDKRNPQAMEKELRTADFIFYRSFDVGKSRVCENFEDYIDGIKVEYFFNKGKNLKVTAPPVIKLNIKVGGCAISDFKSCSNGVVVKELKVTTDLDLQEQYLNENTMLRPRTPIDIDKVGCNKFPSTQVDNNAKIARSFNISPLNANACGPIKKRKLLQGDEANTVSTQVDSKVGLKTITNIATTSNVVKGKWFKKLPWGEKLKKAEEAGTLVLLENLDPAIASAELEDLVWDAFKLRVEAKMIQQSNLTSIYYGKAFVVFGSKDEAESAISKLKMGCLVMADCRPIVGSRGSLNDCGKPTGFPGHLSLPEIRKRQSEEMRKAVSTSHLSQPNTIEYEMATEWLILQEKSDRCWNELHRRQAREMEDVKSRMKMKLTSEAT